MLQCNCIGHLGADANFKNENGKEFITFRIANTDRWTDNAGQVHEATTWVDCIMNGKPKVFDYLKKGQMVFVEGSIKLRVYSSAKERCMKAGLTINVKSVELLGGKTDDVPSVLFTEDGTRQIRVGKYFHAPEVVRGDTEAETIILCSRSGDRYIADRQGWVAREQQQTEEAAN